MLCGNPPLPLSGCGFMSVGPFLASPSHASGSPLPCLLSGGAPISTGTRHAYSCSSRVFVSSTPLPVAWTAQQGEQAASLRAWLLVILSPGTCPWHTMNITAFPNVCEVPLKGQPQVYAAHSPHNHFPGRSGCLLLLSPPGPVSPASVSRQPLEGQIPSAAFSVMP